MSKKNQNRDDDDDDDGEDGQGFDDKSPDYNYKLILVGTAEVGKTSITNRFIKNTFDENQQHSTQVEISYHIYNFPNSNESAELHIWDTLGQEKFKSIAQVFFKGTAGALLVFDLSRKASFDEVPDWHSQILKTC